MQDIPIVLGSESQVVVDTFWIGLMKLAVFSVFVTGIVEAIKYLIASLTSDAQYKQFVTAARIRIATFAIALFICQAMDYGILRNIIGLGPKAKDFQAMWADFAGTASLCMMGASWAFNRFATSLSKMKAVREKLNGGSDGSETS